jgi:hypothetical protein
MSRFNSAELCRKNGWEPGTRLVGDEGHGPTIIEITAIGERSILAKCISHHGRPQCDSEENTWTLAHREWLALDGEEPNHDA